MTKENKLQIEKFYQKNLVIVRVIVKQSVQCYAVCLRMLQKEMIIHCMLLVFFTLVSLVLLTALIARNLRTINK